MASATTNEIVALSPHIFEQGKLALNLLIKPLQINPLVSLRMIGAMAAYLPYGFATAGAASTIVGVDSGIEDKVAEITAILVRLGYAKLVGNIVACCSDAKRADAPAKVTAAMLKAGNSKYVTQVSTEMINSGHLSQAGSVSGKLVAEGYLEFLDLVKQAGAGLLSKPEEEESSDTEKDADQQKGSGEDEDEIEPAGFTEEDTLGGPVAPVGRVI